MTKTALPPECLDLKPPEDHAAEQRVLYAMIIDPRRRIDELADILTAEDFRDPRYQLIFKALLKMHETNRAIGADTLLAFIKEHRQENNTGGAVEIAEIMFVAYSDLSRAIDNARTVADCARRRRVIVAAVAMFRDARDMGTPTDTTLEAAETALGAIRTGPASESLVDAPTAAMAFLDHVDAVMERGEQCGMMTGLLKFDEKYGGLFPGEYAILAADSSAGKTSLGAQIANHNAGRGRLVYVASLEMETVELTQRLVCEIASVNSRLIRTRRLTPEDRTKLSDGAAEFATRTIRIDPRTDLKVSDIRRAARRLLRDNLALVMVDYIGLVEPDDLKTNREQQVARISRGLKNLAKELKVPVIVLCQLNREKESNERPQLKNLRESGAIGNDAHMVLFLHKPQNGIVDVDYVQETQPDGSTKRKKVTLEREWPAELIVAKNRNGETGTVRLNWTPAFTRFECWDCAENMDNYEPAFNNGEQDDGNENAF